MLDVHVKFECRNPPGLCRLTPGAQYQEALRMAAWVDRKGFHTVNFCEHHGAEDGYLPSPAVMAAATAALSETVRLQVNCVIPYHDPVRVAEDIAVLDIISGGRAEIVVLGGYVPSEFAMFDAQLNHRGQSIEEGVRVLRAAWTGEPFVFGQRRARVTPKPVQRPGPPVYIGGGVPRAARRAAAIADGFVPMFPEAWAAYAAECERLGKKPLHKGAVTAFVTVADDPDEAWRELAPHALYETNCYARWQAETGVTGIFREMTDAEALRRLGTFPVLTPEECIRMIRSLGDEGHVLLHPLIGGVHPDFGWRSLELFADKVMPYV
jgi:alkanesulfonate monooxygenase SsuD/methylene tetrahydromethanopterin reductase-like flavin-dependent oxidoreductase (luciferase family)